MAKRLARAVKAVAWFAPGIGRWIVTTEVFSTKRIIASAQDCVVIPAAEYERLTRKAAKRGRRRQ